MLSSASDAQVIVLEDDEEEMQNVSGRRSGKLPVLLNDEHTFEVEPDTISDDALDKSTLEDIVRKLTGLPDSIGLASFAVRERSDVTEKLEIRSLEGLRQAMTSYHSPLFLLYTVPQAPKATNQRRSTTNHPMILLEPYVSELNPQAAGNARTYFSCLHLNSQLSHQALDELRKLFMPLKRHNAELWNRGMTLQKICDDSRRDISKILQLDAYVARLNERDAAVARLDLDIVRQGNPLARNAVRELIDRFSPTGRVNAGHWDKTLRLKECFNTISAWDG